MHWLSLNLFLKRLPGIPGSLSAPLRISVEAVRFVRAGRPAFWLSLALLLCILGATLFGCPAGDVSAQAPPQNIEDRIVIVAVDDGKEDWADSSPQKNGQVVFTVSVPEAMRGLSPTVDYAITPGADDQLFHPASASDYQLPASGASGTIMFAGAIEKEIIVIPIDDSLVEEPEAFTLTLSNPSHTMAFPDSDGDGKRDITLAISGVIHSDDTIDVTVTGGMVPEGELGRLPLTLARALAPGESASILAEVIDPPAGYCDEAEKQAAAGRDYRELVRQRIRFEPGDQTKYFEIQTREDVLDENDECLLAYYGHAVGLNLMDSDGTDPITTTLPPSTYYLKEVTIADDDDPPRMFSNKPRVTEPDDGETANLDFIVKLDQPSGRTVKVDYGPSDFRRSPNLGTAGADYELITKGTLTFLPGETEKRVRVIVKGDYEEEPDEIVLVQFSDLVNVCIIGPSCNASAGRGYGGEIINDDHPAGLSFALDDPTIREGHDAVLRLTLSNPIEYGLKVNLTTGGGTATKGADYGDATNVVGHSVTVPKGETEMALSVPVHTDAISGEGIETFSFQLAGVELIGRGGAPVDPSLDPGKWKEVFGTSYNIQSIRSRTPMPTVKILDGPALSLTPAMVKVTEGQPVEFRAVLSEAAAAAVTFNLKTRDGGGAAANDADTAKAGKDYTAISSRPATIPAGQTEVTLPLVQTLQDTVDEGDQYFTLMLESITGALADDVEAVVAVRDDDARPGMSIADDEIGEGEAFEFTISLDAPSERPVSVTWMTEDGTATTLDNDYVGVEERQSITFAPGQRTYYLLVESLDDAKPEENEQFRIQLVHAPHARLTDPTAVGTIRDNDTRRVTVSDAGLVAESAGAAVFAITLTPAQEAPLTIQWATEDGPPNSIWSAESGGSQRWGTSDFAAGSGSVTFAAGETTKTVSVTVNDDTYPENGEEFRLRISGDETSIDFSHGTIGYAEIEDDDALDWYIEGSLPEAVVEGTGAKSDDQLFRVKLKRPIPSSEADGINQETEYFAFICAVSRPNPQNLRDGRTPPGLPIGTAQRADFRFGEIDSEGAFTGRESSRNSPPCHSHRDDAVAYARVILGEGVYEKEVGVYIRGDSAAEDNEVLSIWIHPGGYGDWYLMSPEALLGMYLTTTIIDDERPQASISGPASVDENAGQATFTVSLSKAHPTQVSVDVGVRSGTAIDGEDYISVREKVTFAPNDTEETVTVAILPDDRVERVSETFTVFLEKPSDGLNVHPLEDEATVGIVDTTEMLLNIPDRVVDEGQTVDILVNVLNPVQEAATWDPVIGVMFATSTGLSNPAIAADVDYSSWTGNVGPFGLEGTFHSRRFLIPQNFLSHMLSLPTIDDSLVETDEDLGIIFGIAGGGHARKPRYTGYYPGINDDGRMPRIAIRDNDPGSVVISGYSNSNPVIPGERPWMPPAPTISGSPHGHVTWTLEGDDTDDFTLNPDTGALALSARDFENPTDHDGNNIYRVTVRATDEDGNTDTKALKVTVQDSDLVLSKNVVTLAEKAGTDSFEVTLDAQPAGDVNIALTTGGETGALTLDKTALTFKPGDWNQPQTVTVTGVDDNVDNPGDRREALITLAASGSGFAVTVEYTVTATVTDDDDRGVTLSKTALTVPDNGGTDSYTIVLDTQPTDDVTVIISGQGTGELINVDSSVHVFTPDNWDQPKTVTFSGTDEKRDNLWDSKDVTISHRVAGGDYAGVKVDPVTVTLTDDDVRGVTISKESLALHEGETDQYTVALNTQPHQGNGVVTIQLRTVPTVTGAISPTTLTFNAENWDKPQTVTVTGSSMLGNIVFFYRIKHQVSGADYTDVKADDVAVTVRRKSPEDDLTVESGSATEGNTVTFTVTRKADTTPAFAWRTGAYTELLPKDGTAADPDSDYTPMDTWKTERFNGNNTVTLSVQTTDDNLDEVNEVFIVGVTSYIDENRDTEDPESLKPNHHYSAVGTIIDNDTAALSVADVSVAEGDKAQVAISLSNPSINDVTVKWNTADDEREDIRPARAGTDYTAVTTAQTVTIAAGDTSAVVEVQTTDDSELEGDETFLVQLSEPTNAELPKAAATGVVTITDDEMEGIFSVVGDRTREVNEKSPLKLEYYLSGHPKGAVTWRLEGDDAALFTLTDTSTFTRKQADLTLPAQDFEDPQDEDGDNVAGPAGGDHHGGERHGQHRDTGEGRRDRRTERDGDRHADRGDQRGPEQDGSRPDRQRNDYRRRRGGAVRCRRQRDRGRQGGPDGAPERRLGPGGELQVADGGRRRRRPPGGRGGLHGGDDTADGDHRRRRQERQPGGADHSGPGGRGRRDLPGGTVLAHQRGAGRGRGHGDDHRRRRGHGHRLGGRRHGGGDRGRRPRGDGGPELPGDAVGGHGPGRGGELHPGRHGRGGHGLRGAGPPERDHRGGRHDGQHPHPGAGRRD